MGFGVKLLGFGGVGGVVNLIEEMILMLGESGGASGGDDGMRAEGVGEPCDNFGGEIFVEGEEFDAVAAFGEMVKLVDGIGGETVNPFHEFDNGGIGIVIGDGGEDWEIGVVAEKNAAGAEGGFGEED